MINFQNIVIGFKAYLESLEKEKNKDYNLESYSDVSIFAYAEEFEDYITDELHLSEELASMDISKLLSMDFSNNEFSLPNSNNGNNQDTQDGSQENFFAGLLNSLFKNDDVKNVANTDDNLDISSDELTMFLNTLGSIDGDNSSISLSDIFGGIENIKNNIFKMPNMEAPNGEIPDSETPTIDASEETPTVETPQETTTTTTNPPSGNQDTTTDKPKPSSETEEPQKVDLSSMEKDDLNTLLTDVQNEYLKPQEEFLASILDESEPELAGLKEEAEKLLETYEEKLKEVDVEMAEQMVDIETRLDEKREEIEQNDQAIFEQENTINECKTNYDNAVSKTANLKSAYEALCSTSTADMSEEDKAALETKKNEAKAAYDQAVLDEEAAKTALEEAEAKLPPLQEKAETLNNELTTIETEKTTLEENINKEYPEIAEYMKAYNDKKQEYNQYKIDAASYGRGLIQSSKAYINEINAAITAAQNKEDTEKYSFKAKNPNDPMSLYDEEKGQHLVDSAYEMLSRYGSSTGYCATGVSRTMSIAYGISMGGHGYQWDTNMDKLVEDGLFVEVTDNYPTSGDLSTLPAGAVVCWENTGGTNGGGAQYGHVCIADGKGGEISDHYQENIYKSVGGRSDQYRIFIPVG